MKNRTHCLRGHELNKENGRIDKHGETHCRVCNRLRLREKRAKEKEEEQRFFAESRKGDGTMYGL